MKKRAIVMVEVDTEMEPGSSSTKSHKGISIESKTGERIDTTLYEVKVIRSEFGNEDVNLNIRTNLAHELGHVVGAILDTKANSDDPRSKSMGNHLVDNLGDAVRASEREAWDIAKEIDPGIDKDQAERLLGTYDDKQFYEDYKTAALAEALLTSRFRGDKSVN